MQKLIFAFLTLIIGVVLVGQIATSVAPNTTLTVVTNESLSIASARNSSGQLNVSKTFYPVNYATGWRAVDGGTTCNPGQNGAFVLLNNSGSTMVANTNYVLNNDGSFTLLSVAPLNGTTTNNNTYVSYQYCGPNYVSLSWGQTAINLVVGFFALALLLVAVALFYSLAKDYGIIAR